MRRSWAVYGALLVAALAGVLYVLGVESAEVVGMLLFAAVFGATLLAGRTAGLVTAGVATVVYALLRRGAFDDVGAAQVGLVVVGRAASYFVLAYVTHVMRDRLPRVPVLTFAAPGRAGAGAGGQDPAFALPQGHAGMGTAQGPYEPDGYVPTSFEAGLGPAIGGGPGSYPPDDYGVGSYEPGGYQDGYGPPPQYGWDGGGNGVNGTEVPGVDGYPAGEWAAPAGLVMPPAVEGLGREQPAPQVPSGWMEQDGFGEEIPVGHTGELFLQDLQGPPEQAPLYEPMQEPQPEYYSYDDGYDYQGEALPEEPQVPEAPPSEPVPHIDAETRLWTAGYFRDRLLEERERSRVTGVGFSVVMIQIPDTPFQTLSYRREVALLRELGHQFVRAQVVDHLVHLPDQGQHWFAVVLSATDKPTAHGFERRLRAAIAGYLRNRGLGLDDVQSAALTSPDDDEVMETIWSSLLGDAMQDQAQAAWSSEARW